MSENSVIGRQTISSMEVFDALGRGVTVVTGNKRLAAATLQAFEKAAKIKGLEVWPTPDILPWATWLQRAWEEAVFLADAPAPDFLLTPQQEQRVWEDIVTESLAEQPLQQMAGAARGAQDAWTLMQSWQLSLDAPEFRYHGDSASFWRWASRFETRCREKGWLPISRLAGELESDIQARKIVAPAELMLLGFDELTPQQQSLLGALGESGCDVHWAQLAGKESRPVRVGCTDTRREAETMARWVRHRLDENPGAEIGVVVPELSSHRDLVIHALDEFLVPNALLPGRQSVARPYNISLGPPLSAHPVVSAALRLFGLLEPTISLEDAGRLLRSPFLAGWEQEAGARALLDQRLREAGEYHLSLKTLRYHASQTDKPYSCPVLAGNLGAWARAARGCPRFDSAGQWSERFAGLLKTIGWACGRPLSSEEYQAAEAWRDLLGAFAALESVTEPLTVSAAVGQLRRLAGERTFQPKTGEVPVQVLGMLEASGLQFDHLWIMGLHDGAWPSPPRPNPFIPLNLQRAAGLPHSSEERELQVSRTITRRMLTCAGDVMVSFPQRSGDEQLRPSPLITDLPNLDPDALRLSSARTWRDAVHDSALIDTLKEDYAPPIVDEESRGGSAVFKLQAACPFRAFAELRLGARAPGQADIGLDAMTRGSLMHRVLEKVWHALGTQDRLIAMEDAEVGTMVDTMVCESIDEIAGRYPQTFTRRFRQMEAERLCRQVLEWLELEKQRVPFRVVEREGKHEATPGGVRVQLKIDRIDELADGRKVVIDYKTGGVSAAQWFGDRPEEPQLPLYSMAVEGDIAGVTFAQIKAGGMGFKGVAEDGGLVPGMKSYEDLIQTREANSWSDVLNDWRATMEDLGEAFRNGEASVDPKRYPDTCTYCELTSLCRINEQTVLDGEPSGAVDQ